MIHGVFFREGHAHITAIDAGTAGVDQMPRFVMAAGFQHVHEASQVGVHVGVGLLQRVAHASLSGQVHDTVKLFAVKQGLQRGVVADVEQLEAEIRAGALRANVRDAVLL